MKPNFDITLPSIPGKTIKFKIQDIKKSAFLSQQCRFLDNKAGLTKKFVDSFNNFHEAKVNDETDTQAETQASRIVQKQKRPMQFRQIVSDNKKYLLPIYADLKKQDQAKVAASLQGKNGNGFSFYRAGAGVIQNQDDQAMKAYKMQKMRSQSLTDNYYFTTQIKNQEIQEEKKREKPSAVFKNQTRKIVQERAYKSTVPGPGAYIVDKPLSKKTKSRKTKKTNASTTMDYKHLKNVITKVLDEEKYPQQQQQNIQKNIQKPDHMFVMDDRDRFGNQIFSIAPKLKVPGPGSYDSNHTLEDKAKKLVLVEEQRKLLKQWFNN